MSKNQFWTNKIKLSDIEDLFTIWSRVKPKKNQLGMNFDELSKDNDSEEQDEVP